MDYNSEVDKILEKKKKKFLEKIEDKERISENRANKQFEYKDNFEEDYGTNSYNEELKNDKNKNKQRKFVKRNFKKFLLETLIASLIMSAGMGIAYKFGYKSGYKKGENNKKNELEKEHLRNYEISNAPDVLLIEWANKSMNEKAKFANMAEEKFGNTMAVDNFEIIKSGVYSDMMQNYYEYKDTKSEDAYNNYEYKDTESEDAYNNFRANAEILELELNDNDDSYLFRNSVFAYSILVGPDGKVIEGDPVDDNFEIYVAEGFGNNSFSEDSMIYDGVIYKKYDGEEYNKKFTK